MTRSRGTGRTFGPLVVGFSRAGVGAPLVESSATWANGLLHDALTIRLTPWRRNWRHGYALAGPALVLGWRK